MCFRKIITLVNKSALIGVLVGAILVITYNNIFGYAKTQTTAPVAPSNATQIKHVPVPDVGAEFKVPLSALKTLFAITECKTKPLVSSIKQRGDYWVLYNYVKANKTFRCYESITYVTQGDYTFLDDLRNLVARWRGPVSVALFAPATDFQVTVNSIAYLRNCEISVIIRDYVTFHVFFGTKDLPKINGALNKFYQDSYNCSLGAPFENINNSRTYRSANNLSYPINVARNVAREMAQTHFILTADADFYPTKYFIQKFLTMIEKRPDLFRTQSKKIFVLPIFEIVETASVPENKTYLRKMLRDGTAILFRGGICPQCHRTIAADKWVAAAETNGLNVFSVGKRKGIYKNWEPFYVGTHADPLFHEQLTLDNQHNRMTQAFAMCLLDYDFMVLDNAFLVHKPGIKRRTEIKKHTESDEWTVHVLQKEIMTLLGKRDGC